MSTNEDDQTVVELSKTIKSVVADVHSVTHGTVPGIKLCYPQIDERLGLWLRMPGFIFNVGIVTGQDATSVYITDKPSDAATTFIWTDRIIRTRFDELCYLFRTEVVPRCVKTCDDLHNYVNWNLAGDAKELIAAAELLKLDTKSGQMNWASDILDGVDRMISWWLSRQASPSLDRNHMTDHLAGLLHGCNRVVEE